jgi:MoaA/NifB/PqqE/SkfB family radical SAM enzyme/SAM-dependent methyltransferase
MTFPISRWSRLEFENTPIYVRPDGPDWFVPNAEGDRVLIALARGEALDAGPATRAFLERLPDQEPQPFKGRAESLRTDHLRELWLHVTNRCNLACSHCLFASGPDQAKEMPLESVLALADQAATLGCRVFALTGGEPFVHRDFPEILDGLLAHEGANVVVLTNGTLLRRFGDRLVQWVSRGLHLQISVDGLETQHDRIRGPGALATLGEQLRWLRAQGIAFTVSTCVTKANAPDIPDLVDWAARAGAGNLHLMWYFIRGRGGADQWTQPAALFPYLREASERADRNGIGLDNIDALRSQAFAPVGTRYDGSTAGWESIAVGPDDRVYPSPALVGIDDLGWRLEGDLAQAWRDNPPLNRLRQATVADSDSPLRFLLGGGDSDHSYMHAGEFVGQDPYLPLHEQTLLWLIAREAMDERPGDPPGLRLKMGEVLYTCGPHGPLATIHTNCLLSVAGTDGRTAVREFYAEAVRNPRADILNPVTYDEALIAHVPEESRVRSYGCGSPVMDAGLSPGDRVVDLGSGSGVECFIASRLVGPDGRVVGVDMLDPMLALACKGAEGVARNLGYRNIEFRKGFLESLPLPDDWADAVVSNCVLNLSTHKRNTFAEIRRILKPAGRLVVADVVSETEPTAAIRNDDSLRGECIAGALTQRDLFGLLAESGFVGARVLKRFPYREVGGHRFYSLTFEASRPAPPEPVRIMYRGPMAGIVVPSGRYIPAGRTLSVSRADLAGCDGEIFEFDPQGRVTNVPIEISCSCALPPESPAPAKPVGTSLTQALRLTPRKPAGCMLCGKPLRYLPREEQRECVYCGRSLLANAVCETGHFVCDQCHTEDSLAVVEHICLTTRETDMIALLRTIRSHPAVPMHGPEHHAMVPGIILSTFRNLGGSIGDETIRLGILRGGKIAGGYCAFMGICGAALGVGTAFSLLLDANPLKGSQRKSVQSATLRAFEEIASLEAPRCCQRDSWLALRAAARISGDYLPLALHADADLPCEQAGMNQECIGSRCPLVREAGVTTATKG